MCRVWRGRDTRRLVREIKEQHLNCDQSRDAIVDSEKKCFWLGLAFLFQRASDVADHQSEEKRALLIQRKEM